MHRIRKNGWSCCWWWYYWWVSKKKSLELQKVKFPFYDILFDAYNIRSSTKETPKIRKRKWSSWCSLTRRKKKTDAFEIWINISCTWIMEDPQLPTLVKYEPNYIQSITVLMRGVVGSVFLFSIFIMGIRISQSGACIVWVSFFYSTC